MCDEINKLAYDEINDRSREVAGKIDSKEIRKLDRLRARLKELDRILENRIPLEKKYYYKHGDEGGIPGESDICRQKKEARKKS